jgi:hypothetical protein
MNQTALRPFASRAIISVLAAGLLVFLCSVSLQLRTTSNPEQLLAIGLGVLVAAVPSGLIAAFLFRRSDLVLVLGAQAITIVVLAAFFALGA